jgi:tetratricopeptide (TPR) repeat protein
MDLIPSKMPLAQHMEPSPRIPNLATRPEEFLIRRRLEQAEQFIRHQSPAQALALLQTPNILPLKWPLIWHPCWHILVGWAMLQQNQPLEARAVLQQGMKTLKRLIRRSSAARRAFLREWLEWLRYFLGVSFCINDQPIQALFYHRRGLEAIADNIIRDPELMMLIYKGMGDVYVTLGAYTEAITFFQRAKRCGQDICAPDAQGLIEWGLGLAHKFQSDHSQASQAFSNALHIFERFEAKTLVSQLQSLLGQVQIWLHHYDKAGTILRQALGAAERSGDPFSRAIALRNLAALHLALGKSERAIRTAQDGLAILQQAKNAQITGQLYLTLARAYEAQHNLVDAEAALVSAITTLKQTQQYGLLVRAHDRYGQFLHHQGRFQEAYEQVLIAPCKTASSLGAPGRASQTPVILRPRKVY